MWWPVSDPAQGRGPVQDRPAGCGPARPVARAGELTAIRLPTEAEEAVRDLVRARAALLADRKRAQQRITALLMRHGRRPPPRPATHALPGRLSPQAAARRQGRLRRRRAPLELRHRPRGLAAIKAMGPARHAPAPGKQTQANPPIGHKPGTATSKSLTGRFIFEYRTSDR
jgi:transposase